MTEPDYSAITCGQLGERSAPADLAAALIAFGVNADYNQYSVRVLDCSHFKFVFSNGFVDLDADADDTESMLADASLVSSALVSANIKHCFEIYDYNDKLVKYLHHNWPQQTET